MTASWRWRPPGPARDRCCRCPASPSGSARCTRWTASTSTVAAGRAGRAGGRERRGQDHAGALHRRGHRADQRADHAGRQAGARGAAGRAARAGGRGRLAGPGAVRQPGRRLEPAARPGAPPSPAVRYPVPRQRRGAARRARHPARRHHPQRPHAVRRPAPAAGGGPGDGAQAPAAAARRAHRLAGRAGVPAGGGADHPRCAGRAPRSCSPATTSTRCSGWPTASSCSGTAGWSPTCDPAGAHPDDVVALISGQQVDSSARAPADPAARAGGPAGLRRPVVQPVADPVRARRRARQRAALHPPGHRGQALICAASLGLPPALRRGMVPAARGPGRRPGRAGRRRRRSRSSRTPRRAGARVGAVQRPGQGRQGGEFLVGAGAGPGGLAGVITVFRAVTGPPPRDQLDLVTLYAGYAASAIERDRLLDEVTARNRVLETIREMLETLAGPIPVAEGLVRRGCSRCAGACRPMRWRCSSRAARDAAVPRVRQPGPAPARSVPARAGPARQWRSRYSPRLRRGLAWPGRLPGAGLASGSWRSPSPRPAGPAALAGQAGAAAQLQRRTRPR